MEEFLYADYDYEEVGEEEYADYYEDEDGYVLTEDSWQDAEETQEIVEAMSLNELFNYCVVPTYTDSYKHLIGILSWSLLFLLSSRIIRLPKFLVHISSASFGSALLWQMFERRCSLMAGLFLITYLNLLSTHYVIKKWRGPSCFVVGVLYMIMCELWLVSPIWWHAIRGIQMVILMKVVSVGYDLDSAELETIPNPLEITGYAFTPGTVIFGPWIPFSQYSEVANPMKWSVMWLFKVVVKTVVSGFFLLFSTCFVNWIIPDHSNRWLIAYRDALSFRSSHYFVSFMSEVSTSLSGLQVDRVSSPFSLELPRSLVQAVIHWNTPMHRWLKTYVFRPTHLKFGPFAALLSTYGMSALFHGLNFQLASVLLSLGFYTYTEHTLRLKLSNIFDACILARPCCKCEHKLKGWSLFCVCVNLVFGLVAAFNLAYLGMMFDSAPQSQESGYNMVHTLRKWSALHYSSHWIALFMYILMSVV